MKLTGKVNEIKRILARTGSRRDDAAEDEKRVYSCTIRLPDPSLQSQYNYGYGNMNFILHGKQMEDFVDLGGEIEVYVVRKGEAEGAVPNANFEAMQAEIYRLEGECRVLTSARDTYKDRSETDASNARENAARLTAAMQEALRLTVANEALRAARGLNEEALEPKQIAASAAGARSAETGTGSGPQDRQSGDAKQRDAQTPPEES